MASIGFLEKFLINTARIIWPQLKTSGVNFIIPPSEQFGDLSTDLAFRISEAVKKPPRLIAETLLAELNNNLPQYIKNIEVAGAGFLNIYLRPEFWHRVLAEIIQHKQNYGRDLALKNDGKIQVEFVSANPTGPLTLGNGRGGFIGDILSNIFEFLGYKVDREYYVNDIGGQIKTLGESLNYLAYGKESLDYHYRGDFYYNFVKKYKTKILKTKDSYKLGQWAANIILKNEIKPALKELNIKFNKFFFESGLYKNEFSEKILAILRKKGVVQEKEGALWLRTSKFGDDKDRVIKKSDGEWTYFFSDVLYLYNKLKIRKYDSVIYILGADHHGYIQRLRAIAKIFDCNEKIKILITQLLRIIKAEQALRISKRKGVLETLSDLIKEVEPDVVRFMFAEKAADTHLAFDLELSKKKSLDNPVYYFKYAGVRLKSIFKKIKNQKSKIKNIAELGLLTKPEELNLIREMIFFPEVLKLSAEKLEVSHLTIYALKLSKRINEFYEKCRIIGAEPKLAEARLALAKTSYRVLENLAKIIGIKIPEKM